MNPIVFQAIMALLGAASVAMQKAIELKSIANQSEELTPEQDAELDAKIAGLIDREHWKVQ